jgi:hypothetical protein
MPPVGFELTIPASARPQTHTLDRTATGIGKTTKTSEYLVFGPKFEAGNCRVSPDCSVWSKAHERWDDIITVGFTLAACEDGHDST